MGKLNTKQKIFCDEYLVDLNATQAAIRAGYSEKTAYSIGQRILKKVETKSYIAERMAEKDAKRIANQDEVLEYLSKVIRGESRSHVLARDENGAEQVIEKPPDEKEKLKAAELLGKRWGTWDKKQETDTEIPSDGFIEALRGEVSDVWQE